MDSPLPIAASIFSFLQPAYTYSRQDGMAHIPISREIIEDGNAQVSYRSSDLTAKDKKVSECTDLNNSRKPSSQVSNLTNPAAITFMLLTNII